MPVTRRTTLGPVSMNSSNRKSFGVGDHGYKKKTARSRMSMAPRVGGSSVHYDSVENKDEVTLPSTPSRQNKPITPSRRQSTTPSRYNPTTTPSRRKSMAGSNVVKDPRPINEKSFINANIRSLNHYLSTNGYAYPISAKILSRPSGKDFNQIVTFLIRKVDPSFNDGFDMNRGLGNNCNSIKFEEEVGLAFKAMGYPFPISKTALVAAGSPHTWPSLLAALTWLIDLLGNCGAKMSSIDETSHFGGENHENDNPNIDMTTPQETLLRINELSIKTDRRYRKYIGESYEAFINGVDEKSDVLEEQFMDDFEFDNMRIERAVGKMIEDNSTLVEQIDLLDGNSTQQLSLPAIEKKREDLCEDLEKFEGLVTQYQERKAALEAKVKDRESELNKTQKNLEKITNSINSIQRRLETQEFSLEDVKKIKADQERMYREANELEKEKEKTQKEVWEEESKFKSQFGKLEDMMNSYNEKVEQLLNGDKDFFLINLKKDSDISPQQSLFEGNDVKGSVIPTLTSLKEEYTEKIAQANMRVEELKAKMENLDTYNEKLKKDLKMSQQELLEEQRKLQEQEERDQSMISSLHQSIDSTQTKITSLRDPVAMEAAIDEYVAQTAQLTKRRQHLKREHQDQKEAVKKEINDALCVLTDHKDYVQRKLGELEEYIQLKLGDMKVIEFSH